MSGSELRLAILQRVCPSYRKSLFAKFGAADGVRERVFIGEDIPGTKVRSAEQLGGFDWHRLPTRFVRLGRRIWPWHAGLVESLKEFEPDAILCEGESHLLGYLQGMWYRFLHQRNVALIHWCFTTLPGREYRPWRPGSIVKRLFRPGFDAFLVYSSFSRDRLVNQGVAPEQIFVATNVGDVERYAKLSDNITDSKSSIRKELGLPERFTILYVGHMGSAKRPEVVLDLAECSPFRDCNFVLLGDGPLRSVLERRISESGIDNAYLIGRVAPEQLARYYASGDVLLVPGRGGIVMSEAMACGLPVVVHQADGTECDLVVQGKTGRRTSGGGLKDFAAAINWLRADSGRLETMRDACRKQVRENMNTDNMVAVIRKAAEFAIRNRAKGGR